jgi:hypothetical protein
MEQIIKDWKKAGIIRAEFRFTCGGDSMGDTELVFFNGSDTQVEDEFGFTSYFEDEVYKHVSFYEASDGHYMGESGVVHIELNDEDDDFEYIKSAQSEWSNTYSDEMLCEITTKEAEFLTEYVAGMSNSDWNGGRIDYKKDFILTDEIEKMVDELHQKFAECSNEFEPETDGEISSDSIQYNTMQEDGNEPNIVFINTDDKVYVKLFVSCQVYEYTDAVD